MIEAMFFAVSYALVGIALLAVGYVAFDLATPGRLSQHLFTHRSMNAAVIVAGMQLGLGAVVFTALWTNSETGFGQALMWTVGFGLLAVVLQIGAFLLLDLITPGSLRSIATEVAFHPASIVAAAGTLAVSAVICASIA